MLGRGSTFPQFDSASRFAGQLRGGHRSLCAADAQGETGPRTQVSHPQGKQPHETNAQKTHEQTCKWFFFSLIFRY